LDVHSVRVAVIMSTYLDPVAQHGSWDEVLCIKNTFLEPQADLSSLSETDSLPRPSSDPTAPSSRSSILDDGDVSVDSLTSKAPQDGRNKGPLSVASSLNANDQGLLSSASSLHANDEPSVATMTPEASVLPSKGSAGHDAGTCEPCHFFSTGRGCLNSSSCRFCHFQHPKQDRPRPSKDKRAKAKRIAKEVVENRGQDQLLELKSPNKTRAKCSLQPYLQHVVTAKLKSQDKNLGGSDAARSMVVSL